MFHPLAHPGQLVSVGAIQTRRIGRIAVQLDNMFGRNAGRLMEIIDILGDYGGHLARTVKAGERAMSPPRLGIAELVLHGEATPPGFVTRFLAREELVEWDRPVLGPKSTRGAEVRDTAFSRDARAGKWHDRGCLVYHLVKTRYGGTEIRSDHDA